MSTPNKNDIRKCVLNCKDKQKLFNFPLQEHACKLWLKLLGLSGTPIFRGEMNVCLNHFSSKQLSDRGETIRPSSFPDINIPCQEHLPQQFKNLVTQSSVSNPKATNIPPNIKQYMMITTEKSKCYLKCKTYKSVHRFPHDLTSLNIWLRKLGLPETTRINRNAGLCDNHFSPKMKFCKRIVSSSAIPDINIPPQCTFINELEAPLKESILQTTSKEIVSLGFKSQPIIIKPTTEILKNPISTISAEFLTNPPPAEIFINPNTTTPAEISTNPIAKTPVVILKNPIGNTNNSHARSTAPPVFQASAKTTSDVICPENYNNALFECVLKCPDPKTLYRFPEVESRRQLWLTQIGLTHCFCNTRICSRHFSEKMLSNKRLKNSAYPDVNLPYPIQPRLRVASLPLENDAGRPKVILELPQNICVLTVVTQNSKLSKIVNDTKYIKYTVDKRHPKREYSVQVEMDALLKKADKAILADEDFDDDDDAKLEIEENINFHQQLDLSKSQVFPSKTKDMFECLKCGEITLDQESNLKHLSLHNELSRLCFQCGRIFMNEIKLQQHEMKKHNLELKKLKRCPKEHCKKAFHSGKKLNQHLVEHAKPVRHFCCNCGRLFFSSLKLHCHLLVCRPKNVKIIRK